MRRPIATGLTFILAISLPFSAPVAAQDESRPDTTFSSNSELVLVPVQVLDHMGQPLRGLKQENFALLSDDKTQRIGPFQEIENYSTGQRSGDLLRVSAPSFSSPNVYSNVPDSGLPTQSVILAIDLLNTSQYIQQWTKQQAIAYLRAKPAQIPTAVVTMTSDGLRQFQGFTTNTETLIAAVQRIQRRSDGPVDFAGAPALHLAFTGPGTYASAMADIQSAYERDFRSAWNSVFASLRSFDEMAWAYAGVPGRKTVLWFSSGFPVMEMYADPPPLFGKAGPPIATPSTSKHHFGKHLMPEFQNTFTALNRANVVIYPVDVTGLPEDRQWDVWNVLFGYSVGCRNFGYGLHRDTGCAQFGSGWLDSIGLKEVAGATGGKDCTAGHQIAHCVDQATAESADYYLLGFYIPRDKRVAGWHELRVNVNVEHGEVRTRAGYTLDSGTSPALERGREMDRAINAAVEYTGIAFKVEPGIRTAGSNAPIAFKVSVPASSIVMSPGEDKLSFDVIAVALTDRGNPLHDSARIVTLEIPPPRMQTALARGWNLLDTVPGSNRIAAVKILVRDNVNGKIGSVVIPVPGGGASLEASR